MLADDYSLSLRRWPQSPAFVALGRKAYGNGSRPTNGAIGGRPVDGAEPARMASLN
jgi:hypothetical protein